MQLTREVGPYLVSAEQPLEDALRLITANRKHVAFVVAEDGTLVGSLTDGDFRRWLVDTDTPSLQVACGAVANRACRFGREGESGLRIDPMFGDGVDVIPIIDARRRVIAIAQPHNRALTIGGRSVSDQDPAFVIAEIGINHNGSVDTARRLVDAAVAAGADCAKFQMRDMSALYRDASTGLGGEDLGVQYTLELLAESALTDDEMYGLLDYTAAVGLVPLCTPWDLPTASKLVDFGLPAFKVASADLTNHELLAYLAASGRPLVVSTGMSTEDEIVEAVEVLRAAGSTYALLHCNSAYPTPYKDVNLAYLDRLAELGDCIVGYSGHERGHHVPVAAVAKGARIVEKHITLDRTARGNDHVVSLLPDEFGQMVRQIRDVEAAIGEATPRRLTQGEQLNRLALAKSLVASRDLRDGHVVEATDLAVRSPGRGLQPNARAALVGVRLRRDVVGGDFFYESDLRPVELPRDYHFQRPWGLPVRFHDYRELMGKSNPDFLEFHLSYLDMEVPPEEAIPAALEIGLTVHSPDLFRDDHILDLAAADDAVRARSIFELQRVIDLTRALRPRFRQPIDPIVVVSMGGSSTHAPLARDDRPALYRRIEDSVRQLDATGVQLVAQTLPPYPWYLGGQRFCNLFVDPFETAEFARATGIRLCLDTSHTKLACTHLRIPFSEAVEALAPWSSHLHLVDAAGEDGEGVQVGDGEIDWAVLGRQLDERAPGVGFIPEIWQGHVGGGQGFWAALERLEGFLG